MYEMHFLPICPSVFTASTFSALILLVGRQDEHPASKMWVLRYWHGYLSGVRSKQTKPRTRGNR